jgi:predicted secreted protein
MTNTQIIKIENEIENCIKLITLENKQKGYSWHISNYKNSVFQRKISIQAFTYLSNGLSKQGKFSCYGGSNGLPYMALNK